MIFLQSPDMKGKTDCITQRTAFGFALFAGAGALSVLILRNSPMLPAWCGLIGILGSWLSAGRSGAGASVLRNRLCTSVWLPDTARFLTPMVFARPVEPPYRVLASGEPAVLPRARRSSADVGRDTAARPIAAGRRSSLP
ncbi:MAG: hypothetical protein Kow0059_21370 [Candidatus Sumerlaeia bacterium]